jgi:hypothetical protein
MRHHEKFFSVKADAIYNDQCAVKGQRKRIVWKIFKKIISISYSPSLMLGDLDRKKSIEYFRRIIKQ